MKRLVVKYKFNYRTFGLLRWVRFVTRHGRDPAPSESLQIIGARRLRYRMFDSTNEYLKFWFDVYRREELRRQK